MLGHGCPHPALSLLRACAFGVALVWACAQGVPPNRAAFAADEPATTPAPAAASTTPITVRLRIEWGGGTARAFVGDISVERGKVADPTPLGLEIDEPGSMYLADGRLIIEPRGARTYDGVDLTLTAPRGARLSVRLFAGDGAPPSADAETITIPLTDVLGKTFHSPIQNSGGNRLSVRRTPGDRLQAKLRRDSVIFAPGELCELAIRPHLLGFAPATELRLSASLVAARQTKAIWSDGTDVAAPETSSDGAWESIPLSIRVPEAEGVYDIVLELGQRKLASRLHLSSPAERRKVQIVVLSPQPPGRGLHTETPEPSLLEEIDPASPGWWDRLKTATLPSGIRRGPLGNCRVTARRTTAGMFLELPPSPEASSGASARDLSWQAYPLAVARPGTPHYLEIEFPSDVAQSLGVSLVEPNAIGAVLPLGVDQGLHIDEPDVEQTPRRLTRRFIVWPRTAAPLVVIMNRRSDVPAVFGKLRILGPKAAPLGQLVTLPWGANDPASLPHAHLPEARADGRLLAAYYDRPLFPENFSNSAGLDDTAGDQARCLDDWVTFYDGARRLIEYLTHAGYNGAMITVAADGGAIYPSRLLEPTPRYDDGIFFHTAQDPLRKDVLELLLRMFDREGLRLIPAVQLTSHLPRLEAERRRALGAKLPDPVAPLRTTFRTPDAAPPLYDPLKPRVEQEFAAVLAELTSRYGAHPSFSGTALHLSADGYTQLPSLDWGADFASLRTFAEQTKISLPQNLSERELASRVIDEHRAAWLNWRADALAQVYQRLQRAASGGGPRPLYLIAAHSWDRPDLEARLQPGLPQTAVAEQTLLESGIDAARLGKLPGLVWMRPYRSGPTESLVRRGAALEIQRAEGLDAAVHAQGFPAGLIYHEPLSVRLESFEKQSPFQPTHGRIVAQSAAVGAAGRRLLVHQLAALDSLAVVQGGWTLPLGQEEPLRKFAGVVRALPAEKFLTVRGAPSYVAVRTLSRDDRTYLYIANDAPWPTTVTLEITASADCPWRAFTGSAAQTGWVDSGVVRRWQAKLEPYDVVGGVFLEPNVTVAKPQIGVAPDVAKALAERIKLLWAGATELQRVARSVPLRNPGFELEPTAAAADGGWAMVGDEGGRRVETERPHGGARACLLYGVAQGAALESEPLPVGAAGRVALSVWLRVGNTQPAPLRLALVGVPAAGSATAGFYRYATVGGQTESPLGPEWRQFVFQVHDLPMQGISGVRIRFELTGPGEVVLDDVRLVDLDFTEAERLQLSKLITLAEYKLERNELGECAKLLDGYWPRFLTTYVPAQTGTPLTATRDTARSAANPRPAPPPAPENPAGMRDRLRRMLPEFLR